MAMAVVSNAWAYQARSSGGEARLFLSATACPEGWFTNAPPPMALVPAGQVAVHDNHETTESIWLAPRTALQQYWSGQIALAPPQIMSLAHLARHASVDSVMTQARARLPPMIQPEPFDLEEGRVICYPGDVRHSVRELAMPGPTRLYFHAQNKRFEPVDGFDSLFD